MKNKLKVGILGATGMVGQRFITLLENHPWFEVVAVAASANSKGKLYKEAVSDRWKIATAVPLAIENLVVQSVVEDRKKIAQEVNLVFCALNMEKDKIKELEEAYAALGIPVISNNSAHRWTEDVPMIIPEINAHHVKLIDIQRKNRGWEKGLIAVKPNCSVQSYVTILTALKIFQPLDIYVTSLQAISGAGKNFETWPEMADNVIPFISGEEDKSEKEPLKIWSEIVDGKLQQATLPKISATCIRVATSDGHMASVSVSFDKKPGKEEILSAIDNFNNSHPLVKLNLPSSPKQFIRYFNKDNRPQTKLDRNYENGMGISMGRLREDTHFDWAFITLSHNTIRGAAGGAILMAELLVKKGYI